MQHILEGNKKVSSLAGRVSHVVPQKHQYKPDTIIG